MRTWVRIPSTYLRSQAWWPIPIILVPGERQEDPCTSLPSRSGQTSELHWETCLNNQDGAWLADILIATSVFSMHSHTHCTCMSHTHVCEHVHNTHYKTSQWTFKSNFPFKTTRSLGSHMAKTSTLWTCIELQTPFLPIHSGAVIDELPDSAGTKANVLSTKTRGCPVLSAYPVLVTITPRKLRQTDNLVSYFLLTRKLVHNSLGRDDCAVVD